MQLELLDPERIIMVVRDLEDGSVNLQSFPTKYL
jgi:hypothetical protein